MYFSELNDDNFLLFAIKHYENPQSVTYEDFEEDLKRFKYLKRLFKRYAKNDVLRTHLILNHLIILYNVWGEAATAILIYKLESQYWSALKTFLVFLNKWPNNFLLDIEEDNEIKNKLNLI